MSTLQVETSRKHLLHMAAPVLSANDGGAHPGNARANVTSVNADGGGYGGLVALHRARDEGGARRVHAHARARSLHAHADERAVR